MLLARIYQKIVNLNKRLKHELELDIRLFGFVRKLHVIFQS